MIFPIHEHSIFLHLLPQATFMICCPFQKQKSFHLEHLYKFNMLIVLSLWWKPSRSVFFFSFIPNSHRQFRTLYIALGDWSLIVRIFVPCYQVICLVTVVNTLSVYLADLYCDKTGNCCAFIGFILCRLALKQ